MRTTNEKLVKEILWMYLFAMNEGVCLTQDGQEEVQNFLIDNGFDPADYNLRDLFKESRQ